MKISPTRKFLRTGSICLALVVVALIPARLFPQTSDAKSVRIGLAGRNFSFLPFFAAQQMGFFNQEGLKVEMIYMRSPVAIPALTAGEIQYTTHFASVVRAAIKGFPVRVILSTSDRQLFSLVTHGGIKRVEDLKGKAVAVSNPLGAHAHVTTQVLKRFGLDPGKDPRYVYLGEEAAWVTALDSGLVAGAFIQPPTSMVLKKKGYNVLAHAADYVELPVTGLSTSLERAQKYPEEVKAMLRAVYKGIRFVKDNRAGAIQLIAKFLNVGQDIAAETYDGTAKYLSENGVSSEAAIQAAIETLGDVKEKKIDSRAVADFTLLKEVLKSPAR
ncbi:MAG: ABC transporter substrate-binding protein [Candidatus Binatia bacterium]